MKKIFFYTILTLLGQSLIAQRTTNPNSVVVTKPVVLAAGESTADFVPEKLGPLCPTKIIKGDRNFNGNGPQIWSTVKLTYTRTSVVASLTFRARETKADFSETKGSMIKVIYTAPEGYDITGILSGKSAEVQFTSKAGIQNFRAGALKATLNPPRGEAIVDKNDGLVSEWQIVGDTNGDDIASSGNCDDFSKVSVQLNSVKVKLKKRGTVTPANSNAGTRINLENIEEWLCPNKLVRGDREYDGHGPKVKCEVKLRIGPGGTSLIADISFSAVETVHDWSTTEGRWSKTVYEAPYGKKITAILSDKASRTQFISPAAGFQFLVPGADVSKVLYTFLDNTDIKSAVLKAFGYGPNDKSALSALVKGTIDNGNTVVQVPPVEGTLVKFFHIVGDTGGPDISNDDNCNDDTRINKIEFFPVMVKMEDAR